VIRLTINRAIEDWLNRPMTRSDVAGMDEAQVRSELERRSLVGAVGRTRYQVLLELNDQTAAHLLGQIDEALADGELHSAKRSAIELTRRQLVTAFPQFG
jgi:hypothetical protein